MIPTTDIVIGGVPEKWRSVPFWSLFRREKSTGFPDEELLSVYRDYGVIPKSSRDDNHNKESEDLSGYQLVTEGALVTNKMKAWQGSIAISRHRGIVSPAYYVYTPQSNECDQYLHYLLRSEPYIGLYGRISKGVRVNQWDLEHDALRNIPVFLPDLSTQREIADFLDRETARIDLLIEKKQKLVKLLGEKRSITVTEAVTGVTNCGSAEGGGGVMRTRIGTAPLRRHIDKMTNGTAATQLEADENTHKVTRIETISAGTINLEKIGSVNSNEDLRQFALRNGDILFSHINSMSVIGNSALVTSEVLPLYVGMNLIRIRPSSAVKSEFLAWCLKSDFIRHQVRQFAKPAINQASISTTNLKRVLAPLPDLTTQNEIADFLDRETAKIDAVKEKTLSSIDRLKEYRSALITSAVTGQIDVTTYTKSGATDCRLDAIQEEMGA